VGERAVVWLTQLGGAPRSSYAGWLLVLTLILLPFARAHWRPVAFALIFSAVVWAQMAVVDQGGTGTHHTVLLWPAPPFIVGAILDAVTTRFRRVGPAAAVAVAMACTSNLLVIGTHYTNLIRNGAVVEWSDALWPLIDALNKARPKELVVLDWGFFDNLRLLLRAQLRLSILDLAGGSNDVAYARSRLSESGVWFISHTPGNEVDPDLLKRFLDFMTAEGFQPSDVRIINDLNGRPTIRLFRAQPK
jgi:hypothetical protein